MYVCSGKSLYKDARLYQSLYLKHPVHIIFSDCNLIGAKAWGTRCMTYFQDAKFNIAVFSSKEKQCKNYNDLSCLIQDGINNDFCEVYSSWNK